MDYRRRAWVGEAACLAAPQRAVQDVCDDCPVKKQCLMNGLVNEAHEYYGGASAEQRRRWRADNPDKFKKLVMKAMHEGWFCEPNYAVPQVLKMDMKRYEEERAYSNLQEERPAPSWDSLTVALKNFRLFVRAGQQRAYSR